MAASKNPLDGAQAIAARINDLAQEYLDEATKAAGRVVTDGVSLAHDSVQVGLDSLTQARNLLGLGEQKIRNAVGTVGTHAPDAEPTVSAAALVSESGLRPPTLPPPAAEG